MNKLAEAVNGELTVDSMAAALADIERTGKTLLRTQEKQGPALLDLGTRIDHQHRCRDDHWQWKVVAVKGRDVRIFLIER